MKPDIARHPVILIQPADWHEHHLGKGKQVGFMVLRAAIPVRQRCLRQRVVVKHQPAFAKERHRQLQVLRVTALIGLNEDQDLVSTCSIFPETCGVT